MLPRLYGPPLCPFESRRQERRVPYITNFTRPMQAQPPGKLSCNDLTKGNNDSATAGGFYAKVMIHHGMGTPKGSHFYSFFPEPKAVGKDQPSLTLQVSNYGQTITRAARKKQRTTKAFWL